MNELLNNYIWNKSDNMVAMREIFHHYDVEAKTIIDTKDLKTGVANKLYINCCNVLYHIFTFNFFYTSSGFKAVSTLLNKLEKSKDGEAKRPA